MTAGSTVEVHHLLEKPRGRARSRAFGLRDAMGNWMAAVMLYEGIILACFVLLLFVREPREEVEPSAPAGTSPEPG